MSRRLSFAAAVAVSMMFMSLRASPVDVEAMPTPGLQQRYDDLTHELRCMQCQNQSIADSPVGLASDLRRDVREQLIAGKTDEEIRTAMVARYGNFILFRPPFRSGTAWVWIAPFLLLILGVFVTVRIVRQRARMVESDASEPDDSAEGGTSK
ncbi:MAG: cytochrome biosis protein [Steroidobacteraceae bacterium]|jgi:cytochrome c-type biogenesis protein CcmH|nr:cytochrome biosis protein [Steroidobacteraceae bacterium]